MAGDREIPAPTYEMTLAITIAARPEHIWPWLVQMGYRRGGLYSYDWLDRLFRYLDGPSAERIVPELQHLEVGDVIPIGAGPGFPVKAIEPHYLIGAPVSALFLAYVVLVAVSGWTTIAVVASIDGDSVRRRLAGIVAPRAVGGVLVSLALLTMAQDAGGAIVTALADVAPIDPIAHRVWIADLALGAPATLIGGVLLWRRAALGYVAGAGLLLSFSVTPVELAAMLALQPQLTGSPIDVTTITGLGIFTAVSFAPLPFFVRGAGRDRSPRRAA